MKPLFRVITLFPEMIESIFREGVVGQAAKKGLLEIRTQNPREFTSDVHQSVDDRPFGGSDGMVMMAEPLERSLQKLEGEAPGAQFIYLSPQGRRLDDALVQEFARNPNLVLICGRYGGIDQRVLVKNGIREISIGDYVLSGGELGAAVLIDAVARQIPGVLGHKDSAQKESFREGHLEAPLFTRPREWEGMVVPEILFSGHHARIENWRRQVGILVTLLKRPDLINLNALSAKERKGLKETWTAMTLSEKKSLGLEAFPESSLRDL